MIFVVYTNNPEVLNVADNLWMMFYGADGFFDQAGCHICPFGQYIEYFMRGESTTFL